MSFKGFTLTHEKSLVLIDAHRRSSTVLCRRISARFDGDRRFSGFLSGYDVLGINCGHFPVGRLIGDLCGRFCGRLDRYLFADFYRKGFFGNGQRLFGCVRKSDGFKSFARIGFCRLLQIR